MKVTSQNSTSLLIIDAIIFVLCLFGIFRLTEKSFLPFNFEIDNSSIVVTEHPAYINKIAIGDTISEINNLRFKNREEVEFYTDTKNIGDSVNISVLKNNRIINYTVQLVNYYTVFEIIIITFVGILFIILPVFVLLKSDDRSAIYFNWANIGLAMVITMSAANINVEPRIISILSHILFLFSFALTPVFFIHFLLSITNRTFAPHKILLSILYTSAIIIASYLGYLFLQFIDSAKVEYNQLYIDVYTYVFRVFLIICISVTLSLFYHAYKRTHDYVTKRKLNWLIVGFLIGPLAFVLFWAVPFILYGHPFMPESLMHLLLISVPVTITIAIVKHQLLDIDLILNKSVVYVIVLTGLIATYILLFMVTTYAIKGIDDKIPAIIAAVFVAMLLHPAKRKVEDFVNKKFFRVRYDYRKEQKRFLEEIKSSNDINTLSGKIVEHTNLLIPVEKIGFFIIKLPENRIKLLAHRGFEILEGRSLRFEEENLKTDLPLPVAVDDKVEPGVTIESADRGVFRRWGIVLVFPIKSPSGVIHGFLVLGEKKSEIKYFQEDIDLLNTVSSTCAITMDRIKLQEELIHERIESERLDELNRMKSYFVSSVSHELKTPLTSIKMFAQLLEDSLKSKSDKDKEYIKIIEGESDRLRRLIDNVLDYAKIEEGLMQYNLKPTEFNKLVEKVLMLMEYQFNIANITLIENINDKEIVIKADMDAVEQAMINLLSNAIKYSDSGKSVTVSTNRQNGFVVFKVEDQGIGISENEIDRIFEPFFRTNNTSLGKAEGTGLGLAIVKHIMDGHGGRIEVKSKYGRGSTFLLFFPVEK